LWSLWQAGRSRTVLAINLAAGTGLALGVWGLTALLGTPAQWIALAIGLYASVSWGQGLALRDPGTFAMIFRSRALLYGVGGFSFLAFSGYGLGFWTAPFFLRVHGVSATEAGTVLGLTAALCGWFGVTLGGVASDWLRRRTPNARLWVGLVAAVVPVPLGIGLLSAEQLWVAYLYNGVLAVFAAMWIGPAATTVNDMVMPRMRAVASAFYILVITFVGLALGPYAIGRLSVALEASGGMEASESLRLAMMLSLGVNAFAFVLLGIACRYLPGEEETRLERARAAGERV
jgi:hypothetical protein